MISGRDSILFYFAGHGMYQNEKSNLQFHSINIEIKTIFDKINLLNPNYQVYVIDACQSGGKVIMRGTIEESLIDRFISNSSGILFMFASAENQFASEQSDVKHGLFTNYFLNAINNESIYDDGILTPSRIQDYISKETQQVTKFDQTPVIELRTKGYYPFAYNTEKMKEYQRNDEVTEEDNKIEERYFPNIPNDKRSKLFEELEIAIINLFDAVDFNKEEYGKEQGDDLTIFNSNIYDVLCKNIVNKSIKESIISVEHIFSAEKELIESDPVLKSFNMLNFLSKKIEPKYHTNYYINFSNPAKIIGQSIFLKSNNIQSVSAGFNFTIYQSLYGVGLVTTSFNLDYDGYTNKTMKNTKSEINSYIFNENTKNSIVYDIKKSISDFNIFLQMCNDKRKREINDFAKKAKS